MIIMVGYSFSTNPYTGLGDPDFPGHVWFFQVFHQCLKKQLWDMCLSTPSTSNGIYCIFQVELSICLLLGERLSKVPKCAIFPKDYHLVNKHSCGKLPFFILFGKTHYINRPFSIVMLNYQSVWEMRCFT